MIIIGILIFIILAVVGFVWEEESYDGKGFYLFCVSSILCIALVIYGIIHGFVNYPPTEGTHQGTLTAVDMEGYFFRHYKVYLKSNAYNTEQGDETEYCVYLYEKELSEELINAIGKNVKLHYSHKGGYIGYDNCGTYHIDNVEVLEDTNGGDK